MREVEEAAYKRIPLEILIHFAEFCEKNQIKYSLGYGTMLGAVRHKGFIPWDDDVDIVMRREEYERFRRLYKSERYPFVDLSIDKRHPVEIGKLYDANTVICTYGQKYRKYGLFVDIIPLDKVPEDARTRKNWLKRIKFWQKANHFVNTDKRDLGDSGKLSFRLMMAALLEHTPASALIHRRLESLFVKYRNSDSQTVGVPFFIFENRYEIRLFPLRLFEAFTEAEFEQRTFPMVAGYDEYLRICYGDYMQLPPEEDRVGRHTITAYYKDNS